MQLHKNQLYSQPPPSSAQEGGGPVLRVAPTNYQQPAKQLGIASGHHQPSKSQIQQTQQLSGVNKAQLLEIMASKQQDSHGQQPFHMSGVQVQANTSSSQQMRKKQQNQSADAHAGGNPLIAFLEKAQQQLQVQQQSRLIAQASNSLHFNEDTNNLHCESIEEEVIQAVRGGEFIPGRSIRETGGTDTGQSEERKRIVKPKGGSIIVASQAAANSIIQDIANINKNCSKINSYHSNPMKKTTASQNKFDIKSIVAAGQDGCYSRRTQSRERSNPTSSQGFQILNQGSNLQNHQLSGKQHQSSGGQAKSLSKEPYTGGERKIQKISGNQILGQQITSGGGGLFSSFFSQPQEHYDFMTKTLGCNPTSQAAQQIQINSGISGPPPPGTGKQTMKQSNGLELGGLRETSQMRAIDIYNQQMRLHSKQNSNRVSTHMIKPSTSGGQGSGTLGNSGGQILFKSFQLQHSNIHQNTRGNNLLQGGSKSGSGSGSRVKITNGQHIVAGSAMGSNQGSSSLLHTLQTFTQSYYGAQHEKNKKRQPHQSNGTASKFKKDQHQQTLIVAKRENSENHSLKNSFPLNSNAVLHNQTHNLGQQVASGSSRQLKFGQIMEELERFSLSNNNQLTSATIAAHDIVQQSNEWTMGTGEVVTVQSSICESDLEYTNQGNIRASTYKRNEENQALRMIRKKQKKHRSEERKKEQSFFTQEYMERRYVNDRVEMELQEFKAEIQKKYETSLIKDFQFPRIKTASSSNTRQMKQLVAQNRGHSLEDQIVQQQLPARITLGGKNVIFKTTAGEIQTANPSSLSQAKNTNMNILDEEFPVEIIKTQDLRSIKDVGVLDKKSTLEAPSFHQDSLNDQGASFTQDSIVYMDGTSNNQRKLKQNKNQPSVLLQNFMKQSFDNRQITIKQGNSGGSAIKPNITGYNSTKKQTTKAINISHDNMNFHTFDGPLGLSKVEGGSQNRNANHTVVIQKIIPQEILVQSAKNQQAALQAQQLAEAQLRKQQKQTPKNYSLQLNQVVKKILNDSSGGIQVPPQAHTGEMHEAQPANIGGNKALNSASFDQMMYEPSFYTTESYKPQGGIAGGASHHNSSLIQQMYFTKDYQQQKKSSEPIPQSSANGPRNNLMIGTVIGEDQGDDDQMMQSYTNPSENKKLRTATSTKKTLKVKRSDSNGSQQKNTLLNKIYRSSKTIKSPQSRQSNMNLNNQNPLVHHAIIHNRGGGSEVVRFVKPSQTVNQSNINSTLNSVRQFQIISKQQPLSQSRQGSSGIRAGATVKSTQKGSRLPSSSNKKYHQHTNSGSNAAPPTITNFQTDTGASFHNYPQSNSNRGVGLSGQVQNYSKDKKSQQTQILIKSSQIKRTSGERSMRDQQPPAVMKYKVSIKDKQQSSSIGKGGPSSQQQPLLLDSSSQFTLLQRSFHNPNASTHGGGSSQQQTSTGGPVTSYSAAPIQILKKQNTVNPTGSTSGSQGHPQVVKSSINSSPSNRVGGNKSGSGSAGGIKSHSQTSKSTQRGAGQNTHVSGYQQAQTSQVQGKIVNLGILNQISNPTTNGKGSKITYRNNYPRAGSNSNNLGGGAQLMGGPASAIENKQTR